MSARARRTLVEGRGEQNAQSFVFCFAIQPIRISARYDMANATPEGVKCSIVDKSKQRQYSRHRHHHQYVLRAFEIVCAHMQGRTEGGKKSL